MATKKKAEAVDTDELEEEATKPAVESVGNTVFVNRDKLARARGIVELVSGKRAPRNDSEADQKERFTGHFAAHEVSPKDPKAVHFVYETLLGGLVRTHAEQQEAEDNATAAKKKFKKNAVGEKAGN